MIILSFLNNKCSKAGSYQLPAFILDTSFALSEIIPPYLAETAPPNALANIVYCLHDSSLSGKPFHEYTREFLP